MDTYRGNYMDSTSADDWPEIDLSEEETPREPPPAPVGQDERRMQVRAYNHWASLLDDRSFPSIEDLSPEELPDFGPYSVMLDFSAGIENPAIRYLGAMLAQECGAAGHIATLADVPARSLLSRITDHYMQILANQAPIGFEAEFINQRERTTLYRGILLPFSSDGETIDFIYGVINWKELADQATTDRLLAEIDRALEMAPRSEPRHADLLTNWADGPAESQQEVAAPVVETEAEPAPLELGEFTQLADEPEPVETLADCPEPVAEAVEPSFAPAADTMGLGDRLAAARALADAARGSEDRTRQALYAAIGEAYDFALAASAAPDDFAALVADAGLTMQARAPMTPVVKLVFGAGYDKTRLTEFAAALNHARRLGLGRGALAAHLAAASGGLKGLVREERRLKKAETGKPVAKREAPRDGLARRLRQMSSAPLATVAAEGAEFTLLVARRVPGGDVVLLGEVADDLPLLEKAAKTLLG